MLIYSKRKIGSTITDNMRYFGVLVFVLLWGISYSKFCGKLGSFDAMCLHSNAVFIISVSPCFELDDELAEVKSVELTIINKIGKLKKYDIKASKDILKPISFGRDDFGVMLEMHYHSGGSLIGNLHVDLSFGNFSDNGINSRRSILEVQFYIEKAGPCIDSFSGASFYPSPACQESKRTGNYSTLCISKPSSSLDKSSQGVFFISMDPCTSPISYWAVALFPNKSNAEVIKQFTGSKTDAFVPVESHTCGFKVKFVPRNHDEHNIAITMMYGCTDSTAVQLINDYYFPELGELCQASKCKSIGPLHRRCFSNMIIGDQKSVAITSEIKIIECSSPHAVDVVMKMEGEEKKLYASFNNQRSTADFFFDGRNRTKPTEHAMKPVVNGFIPKFGGHLSVVVERFFDHDGGIMHHRRHTENMHVAYIIIDRHYGKRSQLYFFPLAFEEITLPSCKESWIKRSGSGHPTLTGAVKAVISISVIAVFIIIIGFIIYKLRNRNKPLDGLPYQIELNYDDEIDVDYKDDL